MRCARPWSESWSGCDRTPRRARPRARRACSASRSSSSREFQERNETNEIYIPPGERLGELVIEVKGLRKGYGERLLIDNLSFNMPAGGIVGIIGPNGAGKTTFFRMLTGSEAADAGEIRIGPSVKLAYVDQSRQALDDKKTVWQEISGGLDIIKVGNYETPSRGYVGRFNFRGTQQQQLIGELSGGERNRVHLAKVLKSGGNVLLLDEPTNDLDVETLRALEEALLSFPGCAVVISHDRWFLDRIATHILAFEGNSEVVFFEGNYQEYTEDLPAPPRRGCRAAAPYPLQAARALRAGGVRKAFSQTREPRSTKGRGCGWDRSRRWWCSRSWRGCCTGNWSRSMCTTSSQHLEAIPCETLLTGLLLTARQLPRAVPV